MRSTADPSVRIRRENRAGNTRLGREHPETFSQRAKESSHDYRYFPDPDLPKLKISELSEFSETELRKDMPELPWILRARLKTEYEMTDKEVAVFVDNKSLFIYFNTAIKSFAADKKLVRLSINYILTDYLGVLKKKFGEADYINKVDLISSDTFSKFIQFVGSGKVNSRGAKDILASLLTLMERGIQKQLRMKKDLFRKTILKRSKKSSRRSLLRILRWSPTTKPEKQPHCSSSSVRE